MASPYVGLGIAVAVLALIVAVIIAGRRGARVSGLVQVSHLKCKKCEAEFDYKWIPASSFTSVRLGTSRYLQCPSCRAWSPFDIWSSRVDQGAHRCELVVGPS